MVMDPAVRHSTLESPSNAHADSSLEGQRDLQNGRSSLRLMQLAVVYLILICEPLSATVIFPFIAKVRRVIQSIRLLAFINLKVQAVDEMGVTKGDKSMTGYYVGFIVRCYFARPSSLPILSLPFRSPYSFSPKASCRSTFKMINATYLRSIRLRCPAVGSTF